MPRVTNLLRKGRKALQDLDLLKVLQSEIRHERSSNRFQNHQSGSLGDFVLDWDSPESKDVVLRRKCESGEEVVVSALLGPETIEEEGIFLRDALMKVCIKKPGLSSILQFDCEVHSTGDDSSDFEIDDACYLQSSTCLGPSVYRGPFFDTLEIPLQDALKQYLKARGIGESLTNFLLLHLNKKEQHQYVNWLHKLEAVVTNGD